MNPLDRLHLDDLHLDDRFDDLRLGDHLAGFTGHLDHLPVDPAKIGAAVESMVESVVEVVTDTVADDLMPAARRTVRHSRRIVTRHPAVALGTVAALGVLVVVLVWLRRRNRADEAVVTGIRRDAA